MDKETITNYLQENAQYIILVVVLIIGSMVFFSIAGIDLNPVVNNNLEKIVTIEKFTNNSFCKSNQNLKILEENCNKLTEDNCKNVECCDMINVNNNKKCKAVNKHGVIYKEDFKKTKENLTNLDNKYYENFLNDDKYAFKKKNEYNTYTRNQGLIYKYGENEDDGYIKQRIQKRRTNIQYHQNNNLINNLRSIRRNKSLI